MLWWVLFQGLCLCLGKHSMALCREVAAAPEPLSASKAAVGLMTLGMRGEGLKLEAAVLSARFCTYPWLLGAQ